MNTNKSNINNSARDKSVIAFLGEDSLLTILYNKF